MVVVVVEVAVTEDVVVVAEDAAEDSQAPTTLPWAEEDVGKWRPGVPSKHFCYGNDITHIRMTHRGLPSISHSAARNHEQPKLLMHIPKGCAC